MYRQSKGKRVPSFQKGMYLLITIRLKISRTVGQTVGERMVISLIQAFTFIFRDERTKVHLDKGLKGY